MKEAGEKGKKKHGKRPEKTAYIWRRFHWFPLQMTFDKRGQRFQTDDASFPRSG